ncbi:MAG: VWA domain-containing protein [Polyangiaceae bacterium]
MRSFPRSFLGPHLKVAVALAPLWATGCGSSPSSRPDATAARPAVTAASTAGPTASAAPLPRVARHRFDLVVVLDLSQRMGAPFTRERSRLEVAQQALAKRLADLPDVAIGLVAAGRSAFTVAAPAADHDTLEHTILDLRVGLLEPDPAAALGTGLALAHRNLRGRVAEGRAVLLVTASDDGVGRLAALDAAESLARDEIRLLILAIGSGHPGPAGEIYPGADTATLAPLAAVTGGEAAAAVDAASFERGLDHLLERYHDAPSPGRRPASGPAPRGSATSAP